MRLDAAALIDIAAAAVASEGGRDYELDDMRGDVVLALVEANPTDETTARDVAQRAAHAARMRCTRYGLRRAALDGAHIGATCADDTADRAARRITLDAAIRAARIGSVSNVRNMQ